MEENKKSIEFLNKSNNIKEKKDKSIKIAILILTLILILIIILVGFGYAKYIQEYNGNATAQIAGSTVEV